MTNNWTDMANSTCVVVMGANPAENHPAAMAHINRARDGGNGHPKAKLIVIDPRKTRTAAQADVYVRIRPGTDIAFIMGLIKYITDNLADERKANFVGYLEKTENKVYQMDGAGAGTKPVLRPRYVDAMFKVAGDGLDYERSATSEPTIATLPDMGATYDEAGTVYSKLMEQVAPYDLDTVADICGCTTNEIVTVANYYMANSRFASYNPVGYDPDNTEASIVHDPKSSLYRSTTMLYAMGLTQHTVGAQNVKSFATLQTLLGNMGRSGGGINALRGIHNVQGSTDMGLLYHLIPGYSANPATQPSADANAYGKYMDKLYGYRLSGGTPAYADAYTYPVPGFLQDQGFYNMNLAFFGRPDSLAGTNADRSKIDAIFSLWPKVNGNSHIQMFRNMQGSPALTRGCVVWGQNPAVTEPNQKEVREGLKNLDVLVCVDMFENETAACDRKGGGVTYLIPACSHVEEAGSVTNSSRVLQWRERATRPKGNSKSDIELLLRFAKALDVANAFQHIKNVWDGVGAYDAELTYTSVYNELYGSQYAGGWDPTTSGDFETTVSKADVEVWPANVDWEEWTALPAGEKIKTVYGSEAVCETIYREMCDNVAATGTMWLYTKGYWGAPGAPGTGQGDGWLVANRAKSRDNRDLDGAGGGDGHYLYKNWGYAWLVNRRVLYNQLPDTPWDQKDGFQGPDQVARLFVSTEAGLIDYGRSYRSIHTMKDKPSTCLTSYTAPHVLTGRFPGHMEPYETPRTDLAATWGRNTTGVAKWSCVPSDSDVYAPDDVSGSRTGTTPADIVAAAAQYPDIATPLVLTTIRCVEHFQGGPITRNNAWNHEAEPEPWVEINALDAAARGIKTGDYVNVYTVRSDSIVDQKARTQGASSTWAKGFIARVGVGLQSNQRVGRGVVAIPWHWGDRGLSVGSRANDLCIDAGDANTTIPEYKACICWIKTA